MATRVQSATGNADPASATFGATPTSGNLLIAIATERSGGDAANYTISGTGWTSRISTTTQQADGNFRRTFAVWSKIAGGSEPTNVQVDDGTANTKKVSIHEFELDVGEDQFTFLEKSEGDTGTGSTSPLSTGSTASVTGDTFLVIGCAIWRNGTGDPGSIAYTNSLGDIVDHPSGGSDGRCINMGYKTDTAESTYETSVSWTGSGHECNAGILVYRTSGGGAGAASEHHKRLLTLGVG